VRIRPQRLLYDAERDLLAIATSLANSLFVPLSQQNAGSCGVAAGVIQARTAGLDDSV